MARNLSFEEFAAAQTDRMRHNLEGDGLYGQITVRAPRAPSAGQRARGHHMVPPTPPTGMLAVVDLPVGDEPDEAQVRRALALGRERAKVIRIVRTKPSGELSAGELNPDDPVVGGDHRLLLENLEPDAVFLSPGAVRPPWCPAQARVIEWGDATASRGEKEAAS